ncbi:MAG TPA: S53 family peptidase [Solirubrobacteraceae bacterium]|nr:S53 family peptidase [Solirubrobacteraceae bacterium]
MRGRMLSATVATLAAGALWTCAAAARPAPAGAPTVPAPLAHAARASSAAAPPPPFTLAQCRQRAHISCYTPAQLHRAYDLRALYAKGLQGQGSTIVIVDPIGSPTIAHDLAVFDKAFGVPAPPRLRIIQPAGRVPPFRASNSAMVDKAGETTLDVEWSHAIAPKAKIVLVETPVMEQPNTQGFPRLMAAERFVIDHDLGDVISQSFSLPEQNFFPGEIRALRRTDIDAERHHVTVLAASNDTGVAGPNRAGRLNPRRVVQWPASDPLVTAVGGTELHLDAGGQRTSPDTVWNDTYDAAVSALFGNTPPDPWASNGGVSRVFARPGYQRSVRAIVGDRRGVPDISMSAAFSGSVIDYASFPGQPAGWDVVGGTSEAAPEFAGIVALADQYARTRLHHHRLGLINPALYELDARHAPGIVDVTRGNNTVAFPTPAGKIVTVRGYRARRGYDLATGIGTVDAARFVPELARAG